MTGVVLSIVSVLGLYVEAPLQLCALFNAISDDDNDLHISLLVLVALCVTASVLVTNVASLVLAFRRWGDEEGAGEGRAGARRRKGVCLALHALQVGLVWRAYAVLSTTPRRPTQLRRLTALRLLHPALASFLYVVVVGRAMVAPGYRLAALHLASVVASLASSSVALACYVLRHHAAVTGQAVTEGDGVPISGATGGKLRRAGALVLVMGTALCLTARLGAFALLSAQHGPWILLPVFAHLCVQTTVYFTCSSRRLLDRRDDETGNGAAANSGGGRSGEKNAAPGEVSAPPPESEVGTGGRIRRGNGCCCEAGEVCDGCPESAAGDCNRKFSLQASVIGLHESNDAREHAVTDVIHRHHRYHGNAAGFPIDSNKLGDAAETKNTKTSNAAETDPTCFVADPTENLSTVFSTVTKRKVRQPRRSQTVYRACRGLAKSYLNTMDLTDSNVNGTRCRHVLYYSIVLVENLAMEGVWMLQSPQGSEARLLLSVGLLAVFLLGLVLKVAACGCLAGGRCVGGDGDEDDVRGHSLSSPGSPRLFAVFHEGDTTGSLQLHPLSPRNVRGRQYSSTPSLYKVGRELYHLSTPRSRSNASISAGTITSHRHTDGVRQTRGRRQRSRSIGELNSTRPTGVLSDYINIQQALEELHSSRSGPAGHASEKRRQPRRENSRANAPPTMTSCPGAQDHENPLVTEGNQRHLQALVRQRADSPDGVWTTSSTGVFSDEQDACSFDDPIVASQLVIESLCGPRKSRRTGSQRTSSTQSRQQSQRSHRTSSVAEPRALEARKPDLAYIQEGLRSHRETYGERGGIANVMPVQRTPRSSASLRGACEAHGDHVQYHYWTRCTCRGSPTSTPRRRPQKQALPRKARSNCTASRPYRPSASTAVSGKGSHGHGACRHRHKKSRSAQSEDSHHRHRRPSDGPEAVPGTWSTDDEESKWTDAFNSRCSTSRPPTLSPHARANAKGVANIRNATTTTQNCNRLSDHWPWCHHHGNDREDQWPRRSFRAALEGGGGGGGEEEEEETASPALHEDTSSVYPQDVVHLWLLSTNAHYGNLLVSSPRDREARSGTLTNSLHAARAGWKDPRREGSTDCSLHVRPGDSDDAADDDINDDREEFVPMTQSALSLSKAFDRSRPSHEAIESSRVLASKRKPNEIHAEIARRRDKAYRNPALSSEASDLRPDRSVLSPENAKRHPALREAPSPPNHNRADAERRSRASPPRQRPVSPITTMPSDLNEEDGDSDATLSDTRTSDSALSLMRDAADDDLPSAQPLGSSASFSRSNAHLAFQAATDSGVSSSTTHDAEGARSLHAPDHGVATADGEESRRRRRRPKVKAYSSPSPTSEGPQFDAKGHVPRPPKSNIPRLIVKGYGSRVSAEGQSSSPKAPGSGGTVSKPPLPGSGLSRRNGQEEDEPIDSRACQTWDSTSQSGVLTYDEEVSKSFMPDRAVKLDVHESLV